MSFNSYRKLPGIPDVSFYTHKLKKEVNYISVYEPRVIDIKYQEPELLTFVNCRCSTCNSQRKEGTDPVSIAVHAPYMTISHNYSITTKGRLRSKDIKVFWSLLDPFRNDVDIYPMPLPNIWGAGRYCSGDIGYPEFTLSSAPKKRLHWIEDYSIVFDQPFNDDLIGEHCEGIWDDFSVGKYSPWLKKSENNFSLFEKEPFTKYVDNVDYVYDKDEIWQS